jgi:chorismate mutase/prephenate dehydratase
MTDTTLLALRDKIDAFDSEILRLLEQRTAVVEEVAIHKKQSGAAVFIRPNREAQIIRRLISQRMTSSLQPVVVTQLWRDLMMASLQLECPFSVAVCNTESEALLAARNHFGAITPLQFYDAPLAALNAVAEDRALLAVLPCPTTDTWWTALTEHAYCGINVVFKLPFLASPEAKNFWVIGRVPFEASGDDKTVVLMEKHDAAPLAISAAHTVLAQHQRKVLLEFNGFYTPDTPLDGLPLSGQCLGGYATPLSLTPNP